LGEGEFGSEGDIVFGCDFESQGEGGGFTSVVAGGPAFVGEDITLTVEKFT